MTTTLKKSSNEVSTIQVLRCPEGVIVITPIRLVCIPDEALLTGLSVIGQSLSYQPRKAANTIQLELGSHEEAQAVLAQIGQKMAGAPPHWPLESRIGADLPQAATVPAPPQTWGMAAPVEASTPVAALVSPGSARQSEPQAGPTPMVSRFVSWVRGKGCWRRRLVFMGLAALSFWFFYPDESDPVMPLSFNAPAGGVPAPSSPVSMSQLPSPYSTDPLAVGLNPPEPLQGERAQAVMTPATSAEAGQGVSSSEPYVFRPNLVRPQVDMPELQCD